MQFLLHVLISLPLSFKQAYQYISVDVSIVSNAKWGLFYV